MAPLLPARAPRPPPAAAMRPAATRARLAILALGLGAMAIVAAGFAARAEHGRRAALSDAAARIGGQADMLAERTGRLLDAADAAAVRAIALTDNRTWPEIGAARDSFAALSRIAQQEPRIAAIWLADPDGLPRLSSRGFPPRAESVAGQPAFLAHAKADAGPRVGRVVEQRSMSDGASEGPRRVEAAVVALTRRISATDGSFGGMVAVVLVPAALTRLAPPGGTAAAGAPAAAEAMLVDADDGSVLALSGADGAEPAVAGALPPAARRGAADGAGERDGRLIAWRTAGSGLLVAASTPIAAALAPWRRGLWRDGALLLLVLGVVSLLTVIAAQRAASEARLRTALRALPQGLPAPLTPAARPAPTPL